MKGEKCDGLCKPKRGFAAMSPEKRQQVAAMGGKAAHKKGVAYQFDSTSAREASKKGGATVSENREYMAALGQKGGKARSEKMGLKRYDKLIEHGKQKLEEKEGRQPGS